ncbi:MAG: Spy/CpxP family protein refolding chaperone [Candidatus Margulisbacteria bacterium]|nr:Spy/CpxP family protein refolding chaperone [Candidatus Margulisiibacteriota bacterium]MBU1617482.1 Spy/CpxP family protein refolding chaperone [Candidatus Margulisiibacteriota bacterium]
MKNVFGFLMIGLICASLVVPAEAARPNMGAARGRAEIGNGVERLYKNLDLTSEQKTKLMESRQAMERDLLPSRQKNEELMMKMRTEMTKDKPDQGAVEGYLKEINKNRLNSELKRTDFLLKFWGILTPEQKEKFRKTSKGNKVKIGKGNR